MKRLQYLDRLRFWFVNVEGDETDEDGLHNAGEEPFGGDFTGHGHDDVHDDGPDSGEKAHEKTVADSAAKTRGIGPAGPKQDEGDCPEKLCSVHPRDARLHFRVASPELLCR